MRLAVGAIGLFGGLALAYFGATLPLVIVGAVIASTGLLVAFRD